MRKRSYGEQQFAAQCGRAAVGARLSHPVRDHAAQIEDLRTAVANTVPSAPPLGLLLWPGGFPLEAVEADFGVRAKHFLVAIDDVRPSWRYLHGAQASMVVFDPFALSEERGGFAAIVRGRFFKRIVVGPDVCRAAVADIMQSDRHFVGA